MNAFIYHPGSLAQLRVIRLAPGAGLGKSKSQIDNSTIYFGSASGLFFSKTFASRIATRKASMAFIVLYNKHEKKMIEFACVRSCSFI